jgi:hypothetical protein
MNKLIWNTKKKRREVEINDTSISKINLIAKLCFDIMKQTKTKNQSFALFFFFFCFYPFFVNHHMILQNCYIILYSNENMKENLFILSKIYN